MDSNEAQKRAQEDPSFLKENMYLHLGLTDEIISRMLPIGKILKYTSTIFMNNKIQENELYANLLESMVIAGEVNKKWDYDEFKRFIELNIKSLNEKRPDFEDLSLISNQWLTLTYPIIKEKECEKYQLERYSELERSVLLRNIDQKTTERNNRFREGLRYFNIASDEIFNYSFTNNIEALDNIKENLYSGLGSYTLDIEELISNEWDCEFDRNAIDYMFNYKLFHLGQIVNAFEKIGEIEIIKGNYQEAINPLKMAKFLSKEVIKLTNNLIEKRLDFLRENNIDTSNLNMDEFKQQMHFFSDIYYYEGHKSLFSTQLSLAHVYALTNQYGKVINETKETMSLTDSREEHLRLELSDYIPIELRVHKLSHRRFMARRSKLFNEYIVTELPEIEDINLELPSIDNFKLNRLSLILPPLTSEKRYQFIINNRRKYANYLIKKSSDFLSHGEYEKWDNCLKRALGTDPTYMLTYGILAKIRRKIYGNNGQQNDDYNDIIQGLINLASLKASNSDYDSHQINPDYESVKSLEILIAKPDSEENAEKQHKLMRFFNENSEHQSSYPDSYGYGKGVDDKTYLVTDLVDGEPLSSRIGGAKDRNTLLGLVQKSLDALVDFRQVAESNKDKLPKYDIKLEEFDYVGYFEGEIARHLKLETEIYQKGKAIAQKLQKRKRVFSHGDFHLGNLVESKDGVTIIDLAKANYSSELYDVAMLLEQEKLSLTEEEKKQFVEAYLPQYSFTEYLEEAVFVNLQIGKKLSNPNKGYYSHEQAERYRQKAIDIMNRI